jgi:antibiotic biosynthesis monooxygenase (ABM) superfamily enzyme
MARSSMDHPSTWQLTSALQTWFRYPGNRHPPRWLAGPLRRKTH